MAEEITPQNDPKAEIMARFNKSIGLAPQLDKVNYPDEEFNPTPKSAEIATQIKGTPFTGINPGLKNTPSSTDDFAKSIGNFVEKVSNSSQSPSDLMKPFSYNGDFDGANFQRYYGTKEFNKLGFNPYRDNDALYNDHRSFGDDFTRAATQWPALLKSGFMSGVRAWGDMFSDPLAPDLKSAREMQKAMAIGSSTKGGIGGFINNTFLNSAYTVGIGGELLLEELALAGITAATGGLAGAGMFASLGKAGRVVKAGEETISSMKNLEKMSDLRTFWDTTGKTAGKLGAALNPLENTWEVGKELLYGSNALKYTKAGGRIDEFARWSDNFGRFAKDMLIVKSAVSEAKLEGGMVQLDTTKKLMEEYRDTHNGMEPEGEEMVKIENIAKEEAKRTALWNMPAIMVSNKLMYEAIFAPFERGGKSAIKGIVFDEAAGVGKGVFVKTGEGLLEQVKLAGKALLKPKTYGKFAMGYMKTNLAEGVQENIQEAISAGAIAHADAVYKDPSRAMYEGYMGHFLTGMKDQFSAQGAETFAGGFLMGSMAQPIMSAPMAMGTKLWDSTLGKAKHDQYKKDRDAQLDNTVKTLNELYQDPMKYFAPELSNLSKLDDLAVDLHHAVNEADTNKIKDIQDVAGFQHIYTALSTGNYDVMKDVLEQYKTLSPEEAAQAFLPEGATAEQGAKVLAQLDNVIKRGDQIQKNFNQVSANYPNPFNPSNFKEGTSEYNAQAIASRAWDNAKMHLIFGKQSFQDHSKRLEEMANAFSSTSRPLEHASAQDMMILLDPKKMVDQIKSLNEQIKGLDGSIPEQKKIIAQKEKQLNLLADFHHNINREEALKNAYSLSKQPELKGVKKEDIPVDSYVQVKGVKEPMMVKSVTKNAKGITTGYTILNLETMEEQEVGLKAISYLKPSNARDIHADLSDSASRKSFNDYLKHLSQGSGDFFFNEKIEKAYDLVKDHMLVRHEMDYLVEGINVLNNPKGFLRLHNDIAEAYSKIHQEAAENTKKGQEEFANRVQFNNAVNTIMKKTGLGVTPEYSEGCLTELKENKEPTLPTEFVDIKTNEKVASGDKFDQALALWKEALDMIKKTPTEAEKKEPVITTKPVESVVENKTTTVTPETDFYELYTTGKFPEDVISQIDDLLLAEFANKEPTDKATQDFFKDNYTKILSLVNSHNKKVETAAVFTPTTVYGTPKGPEVTTTTSSIKDKKADIERRRQEELSKSQQLHNAEFINIKGATSKDVIKGMFKFFQKNTDWDIDNIYASKEDDNFHIKLSNGLEFDTPKGGGISVMGGEHIVNTHLKDFINAKYDAELAALEKPTEFKVTSVTTESSPEAQKNAETTINKIREITAGVKPTAQGYVIQGEVYPIRVSSAAATILKSQFDFTQNDKLGISWLKEFKALPKGSTPEDLIKKLKSGVFTKGAFEPVVYRKGSPERVRFTPKKIDILLNGNSELVGLKKDFSEANFLKLVNALAYKDASDRGNTIDSVAREFFEKGVATKPDGISQAAFDNLIPQLEKLRAKIQANGEIILTNGLIVYGSNVVKDHEYDVAGEMDLLVITPEGKFKIYDVKTADNWSTFNGSDNQEKYGMQLSLYQNLLENLTGIPVVEREIFPILTTTDDDGYIKEVGDAMTQKNMDSAVVKLKYDERAERQVPKHISEKAPVQTTAALPSVEKLAQEIRAELGSITDMDTFVEAKAGIVAKATEVASLDFNMFEELNDLIENTQSKLEKVINDTNIAWAQRTGRTINFRTATQPTIEGIGYKITKISGPTLTIERLGEESQIDISEVTAINIPGEVTPEVTLTETDVKTVKDNLKSKDEALSDPLAGDDVVKSELNKSLDDSTDGLIC